MEEYFISYNNNQDLKDEIIRVCAENKTMASAYNNMKTSINYKTFAKYAKELNVYKTNQPGVGITRNKKYLYNINDIFENKVPCSTYKLKNRLFKEGYKEKKCEFCGNSIWEGNNIPLELHHIDGNNRNNNWDNLQILCPNCHALTDNYRGLNIKKNLLI